MMASVFTFSMVSCGDDETNSTSIELANGEFIEIGGNDHLAEGLGTDTSAAYPVHFKVWLSDGNLVIENLSSKMTPAAQAILDNRDCPTAAGIVDFGKVKSLSKIDEKPGAGYTNMVPAIEEHGYVIEAHGAAHLDAYQREGIHDITSQYMRLWLEKSSGNGYKIQYEMPF